MQKMGETSEGKRLEGTSKGKVSGGNVLQPFSHSTSVTNGRTTTTTKPSA